MNRLVDSVAMPSSEILNPLAAVAQHCLGQMAKAGLNPLALLRVQVQLQLDFHVSQFDALLHQYMDEQRSISTALSTTNSDGNPNEAYYHNLEFYLDLLAETFCASLWWDDAKQERTSSMIGSDSLSSEQWWEASPLWSCMQFRWRPWDAPYVAVSEDLVTNRLMIACDELRQRVLGDESHRTVVDAMAFLASKTARNKAEAQRTAQWHERQRTKHDDSEVPF